MKPIIKDATIQYGDIVMLEKLLREHDMYFQIERPKDCKIPLRKKRLSKIRVYYFPIEEIAYNKCKEEVEGRLKERKLRPCTIWEAITIFPKGDNTEDRKEFFRNFQKGIHVYATGNYIEPKLFGVQPLLLYLLDGYRISYSFQNIAPDDINIFYSGYEIL